jgi:hypothetical protein
MLAKRLLLKQQVGKMTFWQNNQAKRELAK